jgi:beta-lactamase regulating signal transducer with metallopeptidase domain
VDVLFNWLVQGILVAIAAGAGLQVIPASPARARYGFIWAAYLLVLALPALVSIAAIDVPAVELASIPADPVLTMPAAWWTSPAVVTGLLIVWSGFQGVQLAVGAVALRRSKRQGRPCPGDVLARLPHWSHVSATGRPIRVVLSNHVRFAAVLGCGSPVVALAPGLIEQLSAADLDRVLIHEWAHVQRRDDVTQCLQRIVRAIVGWHPAAWWLERQLEFEREAACDEIAVAVTGSTKQYAACLAMLAGLKQPPVRSLPALAAVSPSGLRRRFVRILALPSVGAARPRRVATVYATVALAALSLAVANVRAVAVRTLTILPTAARPAFAEEAAIGASMTSVSDARPAPHASSIAPPPVRTRRARSGDRTAPPNGAEMRTIAEQQAPTVPSTPLGATEWLVGAPISTPTATLKQTVVGLDSASPASDTPRRPSENAPVPWTMAADAGVAIGRSSQNTGVRTAGFFTRFGKRIARSF